MDLYIETNMHPSILFSPPPPTLRVLLRSSQGYFIMIPQVYKKLEKYPPPPLNISSSNVKSFCVFKKDYGPSLTLRLLMTLGRKCSNSAINIGLDKLYL